MWYWIAAMSAFAGMLMCFLLWLSAQYHPGEFPVTVDYVLMVLAAGFFAATAACVRFARALARGEQWTRKTLIVVYVVVGLGALLLLISDIVALLRRLGS